MTCSESKTLLNAFVDGELDSVVTLSVERHIQRCTPCLAEVENLQALASAIKKAALRAKAPSHLRQNVTSIIRASNFGTKGSFLHWRWAAAFAAVLAALITLWAVTMQWTMTSTEGLLVKEIISAHVRSMMANHITDVLASDTHTVKPWFAGKLDFSPPAKDLTDEGFRFLGGRLDYLNDRPVAALVYQRNQHLINLFVWPSNNNAILQGEQLTRHGYNLIHWTNSGMTYWLVSDVNAADLAECAWLLKQ